MRTPRLFCVGPRSLRHRVVVGMLAVCASTAVSAAAPITPIAAVAYDAASVALFQPAPYDNILLVKQWNEAGIPPAQIMDLVNVLIATQSPTLSADPLVLQSARELSHDTQDIFLVRTPYQATAFLSNHSLLALERDAKISRGSALVNAHHASTVEDVLQLWERNSQYTENGPIAPLLSSNDNLTASVQMLKSAVRESGLKSLVLPLPMWTSAEHLSQAAQHLRQANKELQHVTSWSGAVLGLDSTINLTLTMGTSTLAFTNTTATGIAVHAPLSALSHEWLHALEFKLARDANFRPSKGVALISAAEPSVHPHALLFANATAEVNTVMASTWYPKLDALSQRSPQNAQYYRTTHERLAYTFASYVQSQLNQRSALYSHATVEEDSIAPTAQQALPSQPIWTELFAQLKSWWAPPLKNKILARRDLVGESKKNQL